MADGDKVSENAGGRLPYDAEALDAKLYEAVYSPADQSIHRKQNANGKNESAAPADGATGLGTTVKPGDDIHVSMKVDDRSRDVYMHIPKNFDPAKPTPLMLLFNGAGPGAKNMAAFTGMSEKADKEGFIVAYPDGSGPLHTFNNKEWPYDKNGADDIKFTSQVIDSLKKELPVDDKRVYMVGFSQGGSFVHTAANDSRLAGKVSAIADVEGWMTGKEKSTDKNISALSIHGTDDNIVNYGGSKKVIADLLPKAAFPVVGDIAAIGGKLLHGDSPFSASPVEAAAAVIQQMPGGSYLEPARYAYDFYKEANHDAKTSSTTSGDLQTDSAVNPDTGTESKLISVKHGQHAWAGSKDHSGDIPLLGKPDEDWSATDTVWDFLKDHPAQ